MTQFSVWLRKYRRLAYPALNFIAVMALASALALVFRKPSMMTPVPQILLGLGAVGGLLGSFVIYLSVSRYESVEASLSQKTVELNLANEQMRTYNESLSETVSRRTNELLFAELQYRNLFDSTSELIFLCDDRYNALEVNRPVENFFGADRNNLRSFNLLEKAHPDDVLRLADAVAETTKGEIVSAELRLRNRYGEERFFLSEFSPLLMDKEAIVGFKALMKDITAEKRNQLEQEVIITIGDIINRANTISDISIDLSTKLYSLFEPAMMFIYDYNSADNVLTLSKTLGAEPSQTPEPILRYPVEQSADGVAPQTAFYRKEYFIEDCRTSLLLRYVESYMATKVARSLFSVPMVTSGDLQGVLQVMTTGSKVLSEDDKRLIRVIAAELASGLLRKKLSVALAKAYKDLEAKNHELENFVYSVSHDLKAPLISIQGYAAQIQELYFDKLEYDARFCLERIRYNAKNMEDLIMDLLDLSRVGRETPVYDEIYLYELCSQIRENFLQQIEERGVKLEISQDLPVVRYPRRRLEQVLTNLIGNGIRYTAKMKTPEIHVFSKEREDGYEIIVKDNGIGIDKKFHEKVFKIFERLDMSDKSGTGVGLAIVKKIVEQYGGSIWINSEAGRGAEFHFSIKK